MTVTLTIRDETVAGNVYGELPLELLAERTTVRELIRARVYQEVQEFNRKRDARVFRGLVQPSDTESMLNGNQSEYRLKKHREIDWKQQFEHALQAFRQNGFLVLIDDQQAESLDQEFTISATSTVSFVKLTLLVGG